MILYIDEKGNRLTIPLSTPYIEKRMLRWINIQKKSNTLNY